MSEQVHPYCRCLYYAANARARNISRLGEDAFARTGLDLALVSCSRPHIG
jgi:hypothetical protein